MDLVWGDGVWGWCRGRGVGLVWDRCVRTLYGPSAAEVFHHRLYHVDECVIVECLKMSQSDELPHRCSAHSLSSSSVAGTPGSPRGRYADEYI